MAREVVDRSQELSALESAGTVWSERQRAEARAVADAIIGPLRGRFVEVRYGPGGNEFPVYEIPPSRWNLRDKVFSEVRLTRGAYAISRGIELPTVGFGELTSGEVAKMIRRDKAYLRKRREATSRPARGRFQRRGQ